MTQPPRPFCIGLGEVLWDLLPGGRQLGGAPANFAYHAHALGAESLLVSRVGNDRAGRDILARLAELGLRLDGVSIDLAAPTGTVSVAVDDLGQPAFTIHTDVAWDCLEAGDLVLREAARADAICFGSLGQRSPAARSAIQTVLGASRPQALRIFDVNLRQHFWSRDVIVESLQLANVLKLNEHELPILAGPLGLQGSEEDQLRQLAKTYQLRAVALTQGARGSLLLVGKTLVTRPAPAVEVVDTVGAGDSYTAALALGLLAGRAPMAIVEWAHRVAGYVCTQPGATPPMPACTIVAPGL